MKRSMQSAIICGIAVFCCACGMGKGKIIDESTVYRIEISEADSNAIVAIISDPQTIDSIVNKCINSARREPLKFVAKYVFAVKTKERSYKVLINRSDFNILGDTYSCNCDLQHFATVRVGNKYK